MYEDMRSDPALMSLREDLALASTRIAELLSQLDRRGSFTFIDDVEESWKKVRAAIGSDDLQNAMASHDRVVRRAIADGRREQQIWKEINDQMDRRADLVMAESRRIESARHYLTAEEASFLVSRFIEVVNQWASRHADDDARRQLAGELLAALGQSRAAPHLTLLPSAQSV